MLPKWFDEKQIKTIVQQLTQTAEIRVITQDATLKYSAILQCLSSSIKEFEALCPPSKQTLSNCFALSDCEQLITYGKLHQFFVEDNKVSIPFLKCTKCGKNIPKVAVMNGKFAQLCDGCDQKVLYIDATPYTKLMQLFMQEFCDFAVQILFADLQQQYKDAQKACPGMFFNYLIKNNRLFEYLAAPIRMRVGNYLEIKVRNDVYCCDDFLPGAVNKFYNKDDVYAGPLYTYYLNQNISKITKALGDQLETTVQFRLREPENVELTKLPEIEEEIEFHQYHLVELVGEQTILCQYQQCLEEDQKLFAMQMYDSDNVLCESENGQQLVVPHKNLCYPSFMNLQEGGSKYIWNLHQYQRFVGLRDQFSQIPLNNLSNHKVVHFLNNSACLLEESQQQIYFVDQNCIITDDTLSSMKLVTHPQLHQSIINGDFGLINSNLELSEFITYKLNQIYAQSNQASRLASILRLQAKAQFQQISTVLRSMASGVGPRDVIEKYYWFVTGQLDKIKGRIGNFQESGDLHVDLRRLADLLDHFE